LWGFQYAGLRHLIRRGDPLAERWLAALERAAHAAVGRPLDPPDWPTRAAEVSRVLDGFFQLDTGRGKLKVPEQWAAIEADVRWVTRELDGLIGRGAAWKDRNPAERAAAITHWWRALHFGRPRVALTGVHVNKLSVALLTSARRGAEEWVAIDRRQDPKRVANGLRKWRRATGASIPADTQ
jgi:hypothetical protein